MLKTNSSAELLSGLLPVAGEELMYVSERFSTRLFAVLFIAALFIPGMGLNFLPGEAWAAAVVPPKPGKDVETRINADKMTYFADKQQVVFENKVHVARPDFELWADKLTVFMKPPKPPKNGEAQKEEDAAGGLPAGMAAGDVDRLVAERNVRMSSDNRNGTCSKATYTVDDGVLRMEGDPRVTDGENTIAGEVIRYFTNENRSEVTGGGKKRVEAVFSSPNKTTPAKPVREEGKR